MKDTRSILEKIEKNLSDPTKLSRYITCPIFLETPNSQKILLVGSGRSGTTWLSELINYSHSLRFVFEPLQEDWGIKYRALQPWLYCDPCSIPHQLAADLHHLFYGFYRGHGMDTWNAKRLTIYQGRLVKSIRIQGLLSVVHSLFPNVKIIYVIRHPCAVLQSYFQHSWEYELPKLIANMSSKCSIVDRNLDTLTSATTPVDKYMYLWALENRIALEQLKLIPHHLCFYEDLVNNSIQTTSSLFRYLEIDDSRLSANHLTRASSHASYRNDETFAKVSPLERWRSKLSRDLIDRCLKITRDFGLADVYDEGSLPNPHFSLASLPTLV